MTTANFFNETLQEIRQGLVAHFTEVLRLKLKLNSREEFDIQGQVLADTRLKIKELERELQDLKAKYDALNAHDTL